MSKSPLPMTVGSLFAGIGGFDLAARWMGWTTKWYSEIDPYACKVMGRHFPEAESLGDITKIKSPPPVRLLCGGFPCQDISAAGKGAGIDGARSGLWSHYARLIGEVAPSWVVIENVPTLRSRGFERVLGNLHALGYDAEWHCIPASAVGAPHQRDRIWIIAHPEKLAHAGCGGPLVQPLRELGELAATGRREESAGDPVAVRPSPRRTDVPDANRPDDGPVVGQVPQSGDSGSTRDVSHTGSLGLEGVRLFGEGERAGRSLLTRGAAARAPSEDHTNGNWWASEPDVGRVAHGVPSRVDRLRCLGNAIVPHVAYHIFQAIEAYERER